MGESQPSFARAATTPIQSDRGVTSSRLHFSIRPRRSLSLSMKQGKRVRIFARLSRKTRFGHSLIGPSSNFVERLEYCIADRCEFSELSGHPSGGRKPEREQLRFVSPRMKYRVVRAPSLKVQALMQLWWLYLYGDFHDQS